MAKRKDDGKFKGAFEHTPQALGGRKSKHPVHANSLANLAKRTPWQPGQSANPGGRPRQHKESVNFWRSNMEEIDARYLELLRQDPSTLTKAEDIWFKAATAIREFAFGRPAQGVIIGGALDVSSVTAAEGEGVSALLARARLEQSRSIEAKPDE